MPSHVIRMRGFFITVKLVTNPGNQNDLFLPLTCPQKPVQF